MSALCPVLNAIIIIFTFDGTVHFVNHDGQILQNATIDPLVVRTKMNIVPALNDVSDPLSIFYIDKNTAFPVEYQREAEAKPSEGLYVYRGHLFITKDTSALKNLPTARWVLPFLPMGALEVRVTTKSVKSVRTTDWIEDFYVSVSDVHLVSTVAPPDARALFVGHNYIFTEDWTLPFDTPIRSVFVQTSSGTYEVVGHSTTWTVFCELNSCRPVIFPDEAMHEKKLLSPDSSVKRAFVVANGVSPWGVLENPEIRFDPGFTDWPRLPPARNGVPAVYPRVSIFPIRKKRWWILALVVVMGFMWLMSVLLDMVYTKQLHFFYASPLVDESYNRILPLEVDKEMEGLHAVPSVASLERIRDAAVSGAFIHLSCHTKGAQLIFEDHGVSFPVSQEQLIEALDGAWFVFLAACDTWHIVDKLPKSVAFAIGTIGAVTDKDIRKFARSFYTELYAHGTIENSFRKANCFISSNPSVFSLRALDPVRSRFGRIGQIMTLGASARIIVPGLRRVPVLPTLDFGLEDVVGREKDMVRMALLFRQRRVIALAGYGPFVFAKEFVRYFSLPGRTFTDVIFARSQIPDPILCANTKGGLLVLEPHVDASVLTWLVENWPPWPDCHVLVTGNTSEVVDGLAAQLPCKVARMELPSLPHESSTLLFMRRVHRPLGDKDFNAHHPSATLTQLLQKHPVVGPVLRRGDPDMIIRLAQRVSSSLKSLFDLREEVASLTNAPVFGEMVRIRPHEEFDKFPPGNTLSLGPGKAANSDRCKTDGAPVAQHEPALRYTA